MARPAHHGRDADALEQAGLGPVGHLAGDPVRGQGAHQLRDGGLLGRLQAGRRGAGFDVDAGLRVFGAHARQQLVAHVALDLGLDGVGRHARQVAELVRELAQLGDGVDRDPAVDLVGGHGRERHIVELVIRAVGLVRVGQVADAADQPRRVFDGVAAARRQRRMRRLAMDPAAKQVDALVRHHHLHAGRLADHAALRLDAAFAQVGQHDGRAGTADLLVIRKRQMDGFLAGHLQERRHQGQRRGDEALHVARTPPVQPPLLFAQGERVGGPVLSIDRHDIGMAGQHDAALLRAIAGWQRGEQIGLGALGVVRQPGLHALPAEPVPHGFDQRQVGIAAGGVDSHQRLEPGASVHGIPRSVQKT
ncbi:Uncharacterised protein [Bordetella pertussis]|nr:Uncharacterised protein [Bordetella pertussis]